MFFLSNTIITILVVFLLLLPSFIFLRFFWGSSKGKIHVDNIYKYFICGLPVSILIYGLPILLFPRYLTPIVRESWNLVADEAHKVDSAGRYTKLYVDTIHIKTQEIRRQDFRRYREAGAINDTATVTSTNTWRINDTTNVISYEVKKSRLPVSYTRKILDSIYFLNLHNDTIVGTKPSYPQYKKMYLNLYELKGRIILLLVILSLVGLLVAIGWRWLVRATLLDKKFDALRIESDLHYILSGWEYQMQSDNPPSFRERMEDPFKKTTVLVDLLCEIGDKMKIYRGVIKKFRVRDECIEFIVLKQVQRGDLLSEKNGEIPSVPNEFEIGELKEKDTEIRLSIKITKHLVELIDAINHRSAPSIVEDDDLNWFKIKGEFMYFKADQIKNINIINESSCNWPVKHRKDNGDIL